jgi:hypothetical protein
MGGLTVTMGLDSLYGGLAVFIGDLTVSMGAWQFFNGDLTVSMGAWQSLLAT